MFLYFLSAALLLVSCFYTPWLMLKLWHPWTQSTSHHAQRLLAIICYSYSVGVVIGYMGIITQGLYTLDSPLYGILYNLIGLLLMLHIYMTFCAAIAGIVLMLGGRKSSPCRIAAGIISVLISVAATLYGFVAAQTFEVTHLHVKVGKLKHPVTFAHLSDVHLGHQRDATYLKQILDAIAPEHVDFILYNGDFFDSNAALKPALIETLSAVKTPQYFTTGNHENYIDKAGALSLLEAAGVRILSSEKVVIHDLQLVGMEYMNADVAQKDPHSVNSSYLNVELPKIKVDLSKPVLVAHHSPIGLDYIADYGADFYVAGHTHAGQVFPANWLAGLIFPVYKGIQDYRDMKVIVSQGTGTFGPWMRLGTRNEVQIITLE